MFVFAVFFIDGRGEQNDGRSLAVERGVNRSVEAVLVTAETVVLFDVDGSSCVVVGSNRFEIFCGICEDRLVAFVERNFRVEATVKIYGVRVLDRLRRGNFREEFMRRNAFDFKLIEEHRAYAGVRSFVRAEPEHDFSGRGFKRRSGKIKRVVFPFANSLYTDDTDVFVFKSRNGYGSAAAGGNIGFHIHRNTVISRFFESYVARRVAVSGRRSCVDEQNFVVLVGVIAVLRICDEIVI